MRLNLGAFFAVLMLRSPAHVPKGALAPPLQGGMALPPHLLPWWEGKVEKLPRSSVYVRPSTAGGGGGGALPAGAADGGGTLALQQAGREAGGGT